MIGMWSQHSAEFLRVFAGLTLVAFAIPISVAPMAWARALRWEIDAKPHLALYFGRCLGAIALVLVWGAWHAAARPELQPFYFDLFIGSTALLALVHVVGALQRVQPLAETAEIPFWAGLAALGLLFYPG